MSTIRICSYSFFLSEILLMVAADEYRFIRNAYSIFQT